MPIILFSTNIYLGFIGIFLTIELCNFFRAFILSAKSTVMNAYSIFKDARFFQILFQFIFLSYGIGYLHWSAETWLFTTYITVSLLTQLLCEIAFKKNLHKKFSHRWWTVVLNSLPSAFISSLSLCLLLKTNTFSVAVAAAAVSILSKYILRIGNKHIFNPSALGIAFAVFVTGNAWISPGQWGSGAVILFTVLSLGFIVTTKVQKLGVSIAFLGTFIGLLFIRQIWYLGWPMDFFVQSITTGSLLLFSFFMISDPKTTPNHTTARILWSIGIAIIAFYLANFQFINGAPIWVLVLSQPLVPLLDYFFKARAFKWSTKNNFQPAEKKFLQTIYQHASI